MMYSIAIDQRLHFTFSFRKWAPFLALHVSVSVSVNAYHSQECSWSWLPIQSLIYALFQCRLRDSPTPVMCKSCANVHNVSAQVHCS